MLTEKDNTKGKCLFHNALHTETVLVEDRYDFTKQCI